MPVSSGTTPDVSYDFTSGDDLLSDLRQASQKLQEFITLRSKLAGTNLTYQKVSGQQQGWVGTAYSQWASQFDRSQNDLNGYLDQLNWHIVNMNNFLYDTELAVYKSTRRTRLPAPAAPPSPVRAPVNNFKLTGNPEGATPACLYAYSDQATSSNDQIRSFFKVTLPGAAGAYPKDPQYRASAYTGALIPVSGLGYDVAAFLRQAVLVLDARVRIVGQAFENADRYGITAPGSPDSGQRFDTLPSAAMVNGLANQIAAYESPTTKGGQSQSTIDGANAGKQLNNMPAGSDSTAYSQLLQQIDEHKDDPAWTSAFFSTANGASIEMLLKELAMYPPDVRSGAVSSLAQAYATALGAGTLSGPASVTPITMFLEQDDPIFNTDLLQDLKAEPAAAANFLDTVPTNLQIEMLNGPYSPQVIDLYTAILATEPDAASASAFYSKVTQIIFQSQPETAAASFKAAQQFLATYIALTFPPLPTPVTDTSIQNWAPDDIGPWLTSLEWGTDGNGGWHQWVVGFESANLAETAADQQALGLVLGAASTAIIFMLTDAFPPLAPLGWQLLMGVITGEGANWITNQVNLSGGGDPTTDPETMDDYVRYMASYMVTAELLASGKLTKNGQPVLLSTDPSPQAQQANQQLMKQILDDVEPEDPADRSHPPDPQYYIAGTNQQLRTIASDARGDIQPPSEHFSYSGSLPP